MITRIQVASEALAKSISDCMAELREALVAAAPGAHIYGVALVVLDDFSDLQAFANTDAHLAELEGASTDKWYFAEWWSEGMGIDFDALEHELGEVEDWDEDEEPEKGNAPRWLAAMTHAMQLEFV